MLAVSANDTGDDFVAEQRLPWRCYGDVATPPRPCDQHYCANEITAIGLEITAKSEPSIHPAKTLGRPLFACHNHAILDE